VIESRVVGDGRAVRRRRECEKCGRRYTTLEKPKEVNLWVIKKDHRREPFEIEKIRRGVLRAFEKRPTPMELIEDLVRQVEREMMRKSSEEVSSRAIGGAILRRLKRMDKVAWLRFASVYMEFEDLDDFKKAM
jgi:transcriptional repressor NrdR